MPTAWRRSVGRRTFLASVAGTILTTACAATGAQPTASPAASGSTVATPTVAKTPAQAPAATATGAASATPVATATPSAAATPAATATSNPASSAAGTSITLYSGQHEGMAKAFASGFEAASGIKVAVRTGEDAELANQIIEEGSRTKADVFITEEPGWAAVLGAKGIFAPVDPATLAKTDSRFNPSNGSWLAYAARSRAIFYNPKLIAEDKLPASILDLTKPEWKGKFAYAPSGAFVGTVTYLINTIGEDKTLTWLQGIKENGQNLQKNGAIRDAVEAGQIGFGLSNHYYWYILAQQKGGPDKLASKVHFMGHGDAGALMLASGAGIPKASARQAEGQKFLAWLADPEGGQKVIATTTPQYPLAPGVESTAGLKPLKELDPPKVDQGSLGNPGKAKDLIIKAGIV